MRKVIIITTVVAVILTLGFGIFWKECDMIWWFFPPSYDTLHMFNWVDVSFDFFGLHVVWKINLYNSWCLFMSLEVLCFIGVVVTLLAGVLWYYLRPDAIYLLHPTEVNTFLVSYDRGKNWKEEEFTIIEE